MATTNVHRPTPVEQRVFQRRDERTSYAAVWIIIVVAIVAAIAFGYYTSDPDSIDAAPIARTQAVTPTTDGSTSSMTGTTIGTGALTPSVTTPGTPDTTTTESSNIPADGIR